MFPENRAVGWRDADRAGAADQYDLYDAIDRHAMRRAIAAVVDGTDPTLTAARRIVAGQSCISRHDDHVIDDERRAGETPFGHGHVGLGRDILRPHNRSGGGVEPIQNDGYAK